MVHLRPDINMIHHVLLPKKKDKFQISNFKFQKAKFQKMFEKAPYTFIF